ncbi:hypothetical protein B0H67DRAFT_260877 [Lasiosphaeris hirsuta]|uniref:NACHT domain-containing protein n=1 Tax=Lasiosphaeris hirsuta TaxID=260670 RepID=A0AA40DU16_9PEZI|nr:hypothetical protein B0H67DRAFT_260877 [Lasiosphaeris hirsuta]
MDPLSSLSAAASILSVIQFSGGLLKTVREICRSSTGLSVENTNIELSCLQLRQKAESLAQFAKGNLQSFSGEDGEDLIRIADKCVNASRQILQSLDRVRAGEAKIESGLVPNASQGDDGEGLEAGPGQKFQDAQRRRLRVFRKAIKAAWTEDETAKAARTMSDLSRELELHILTILQKGQVTSSVLADHRYEALRNANKELVRTILENRTVFLEETRSRIDRICEAHESSLLRILSKLTERIPTDREIDAEVHRSILGSLRFPAMCQRYEEVNPAYHSTFEWIFRSELDTVDGSSFPEWLRSGHGLYWINGKPASGKSTLMRYIIDSGRAHELLRVWSTGHDLSVFTFFFWSGGTAEQRSLRGIFQSILYQFLAERPEHTKVIFPDEYDRHYRRVARREEQRWTPATGWSMKDLRIGFEKLVASVADSDNRLCLFIDGLDEYEGNHTEIARFFSRVVSREHVKICVSSRPWLEFGKVFGECPSLKLQDLTKGDIEIYVGSRLAANESFAALSQEAPEEAKNLINRIVKLANGVFLWVKLVLNSLIKGLDRDDDLDDLSKQLKCLPRGLNDLYTHILKTIESPLYLEEAAMYFEVLRTARHSQDLAGVAQMGEDDECAGGVMSLAAFALADGKNLKRLSRETSWTTPRHDLMLLLCRQTESRLKSRCMGLIEVSEGRGNTTQHSAVSYIHRTLIDFLGKSWVRELMSDAIKDRSFSPNLNLARSCLFHVRFTLPDAARDPGIGVWRLIQLCMVYMSLVTDARFTGDVVSLVDQLDSTMSSHCGRYDSSGFHWTTERVLHGNTTDQAEREYGTLSPFCIKQGLCLYVESALNRGGLAQITVQGTRPLLDCAVRSLIADSGPTRVSYQNHIRICKALLNHGAAPNQTYQLRSPWQLVLSHIIRRNSLPSDPNATRTATHDQQSSFWLDIVLAFIERGADLNATVPNPTAHTNMSVDAISIFRSAFVSSNSPHLPSTALLEQFLARHEVAPRWLPPSPSTRPPQSLSLPILSLKQSWIEMEHAHDALRRLKASPTSFLTVQRSISTATTAVSTNEAHQLVEGCYLTKVDGYDAFSETLNILQRVIRDTERDTPSERVLAWWGIPAWWCFG